MKFLVISKSPTLGRHIRQLTHDFDVTIVETTTPEQAVADLSRNEDYRLVIVSMASIWGGSRKWGQVASACCRSRACIFVPDTCEINAISSVIMNNQVVCPLETPAGKLIFSKLVHGLARAGASEPVDSNEISAHDTTDPDCPEDGDTRPRLTRRQKQVFKLMLTGKSNREIAKELEVTEGTIKIHSLSIYRSLGVSNRVHAVLRGQQLASLDRDRETAQ